MKTRLLYAELKSGYSGDDGPAWIGQGAYSRSGRTIYFNGKAFQSCKGAGIGANFFDLETGEEYWISGVKRNERNRHRYGRGKVMIDQAIIADYLREIGAAHLSSAKYDIVSFAANDPRGRIHGRLNSPATRACAELQGRVGRATS